MSVATKRKMTVLGLEKILPSTPGKRRRGHPLKILHAKNKSNVKE